MSYKQAILSFALSLLLASLLLPRPYHFTKPNQVNVPILRINLIYLFFFNFSQVGGSGGLLTAA